MRTAAVSLLIVLLACASPQPAPRVRNLVFRTSRGAVVIHAAVADTERLRERGLMGVRDLAPDRGMLFLWGNVRPRTFWMKDTLIALDLVSLRAGRVVAVASMVPCRGDPCPLTPTPAVSSALEIEGGRAAAAGIVVGIPVSGI